MPSGRLASRPRRTILLLLLCGGTACACSGGQRASSIGGSGSAGADAGSSGSAGADAGSSGSAGADAGSSAGSVTADAIPDFNGCTNGAYIDQRGAGAARTIGIATMGLSFTPKCLIVQVGQTVRWEGSLSTHPLAPGNPDHPDAGSLNSPIVETSSGQRVEFIFTEAGTFPYYCEVHSFGDGKGMAGVVHVVP